MDKIKQYRQDEMKWYVIAYVLLIIFCRTSFDDGELLSDLEKLVSSVLLSGVIGTLTYVLDSIYSSKSKETLLFMGLTKMPGKTIFNRIKDGRLKDSRIYVNDAQLKYKEIINNIPDNKSKEEYENSHWYIIYSSHKEDSRVQATQYNYLLCRDLYISTVSMTIISVVAIIMGIMAFNRVLFSYLALMLVITNIAAHNKANRFVNTVIAVDISSKEE